MPKLAVVNFPSSAHSCGYGDREYHYKTYLEDLKEGDFVVVETAERLTVARFKKYVNSTSIKQLKYIVQKVDLKKHKQMKEQCELEALLD